MEVSFKPSFIKDFEKLPRDVRAEVRSMCLELFPKIYTLAEMHPYRVKPLHEFKQYYRIKLGNYRIGFKKENHSVIFMRVLDRKDIYKHFP